MTSLDLLYKILDLLCYKKDNKDYYDTKLLKNNPPAYNRLLQVEAMMRAFGLAKKEVLTNILDRVTNKNEYDRGAYLNKLTQLGYLLRGEFFHDKDIESEYTHLKAQIVANARQLVPGLPQHFYERPLNLGWLFNSLIDFRIDIQPFAKKPGGFVEGFDIAAFYGHCKQAYVAEVLEPALKDIDELLALLLDPQKRDFSLQELVEKYNYPDVDLQQLDSDYLMDNY